MKTVYYTAASLDGFIADEEHSIEWLMQFPGGDESTVDFMSGVGAIAMGSSTYRWLLDYYAKHHPNDPTRWEYSQPVWVFSSRTLPGREGADIRFVSGDVAPHHAAMVAAADGKNVWLMGGGDLVGQFADKGLLDELVVTVAPVTLGGGAPLLPRRIATPALELVSVRQVGAHFAELIYRVAKGG
ncbi:MAG: dihydrofolate reductase [Trueperaceae bacterium]|nr:dihydrofolate reductase [Trueperaceae bacterium]